MARARSSIGGRSGTARGIRGPNGAYGADAGSRCRPSGGASGCASSARPVQRRARFLDTLTAPLSHGVPSSGQEQLDGPNPEASRHGNSRRKETSSSFVKRPHWGWTRGPLRRVPCHPGTLLIELALADQRRPERGAGRIGRGHSYDRSHTTSRVSTPRPRVAGHHRGPGPGDSRAVRTLRSIPDASAWCDDTAPVRETLPSRSVCRRRSDGITRSLGPRREPGAAPQKSASARSRRPPRRTGPSRWSVSRVPRSAAARSPRRRG